MGVFHVTVLLDAFFICLHWNAMYSCPPFENRFYSRS